MYIVDVDAHTYSNLNYALALCFVIEMMACEKRMVLRWSFLHVCLL